MIKILVNNILRTDKIDGCVLYRNLIPFEALSGMGYEIVGLPIPTDKFDYQIGWFNRMYGPGIDEVVATYRKGGAKILFECDDLIDHVSNDNPFKAADYKPAVKGYKFMLQNADVITTTTEYLKQEMQKQRGKPIVVIPNSIREMMPRPEQNERIRIGYAGGFSHYKDLDFILDIILDLQKKYDFDFVTLGLGPDPEMDKFKDHPYVYEHVKKSNEKLGQVKNYTFVPHVKPWLYQKTLSDLDLTIGVCPLQDNTFSRCKSAIKYYEYASVGTATLAQDIVTYQDCNYTAKRFSEWRSKLERLITDISFREELLEGQMKYVNEKRHIDIVKYQWDKVLKELLK